MGQNREVRNKIQETRYKKRETRYKKRETRYKKRETRYKKRETRNKDLGEEARVVIKFEHETKGYISTKKG